MPAASLAALALTCLLSFRSAHSFEDAHGQCEAFELQDHSSSMAILTTTSGWLSVAVGGNRIAFTSFGGRVTLAADPSDSSRMNVTIQADSLEVLDTADEERRETILTTMRGTVMETSRFPTVEFESAWRDRPDSAGAHVVNMRSNLTLHGVTRSIPLSVAQHREGDVVRFRGEFALLHSDYGMVPAEFLGGLIRVDDLLRFRFELVGYAAPPERSPQP